MLWNIKTNAYRPLWTKPGNRCLAQHAAVAWHPAFGVHLPVSSLVHLPATSCITNRYHSLDAHRPAFCHGPYGITFSETALRRTTQRRQQKTKNGPPRSGKDPENDGGSSSPSCRRRRKDRHYKGRWSLSTTAPKCSVSCSSIRGSNSRGPSGCHEGTRVWRCL